MNGNAFDAFTRQASDAISRRTSLLTFGGAALTAAVAAPSLARAKKKGNKAKKKCKKQQGKCEESVREFCDDPTNTKNEEACLDFLLPCCDFFKNCNAKQGVECLLDPFFFTPPPP